MKAYEYRYLLLTVRHWTFHESDKLHNFKNVKTAETDYMGILGLIYHHSNNTFCIVAIPVCESNYRAPPVLISSIFFCLLGKAACTTLTLYILHSQDFSYFIRVGQKCHIFESSVWESSVCFCSF